MNDPERFSVATRLYVRLRRLGGPTIDPLRMLNDDEYALETVQRIAATATDPEIIHMAARLDAILHHMRMVGDPVRQTAPLPPRSAAAPSAPVEVPEVAKRYVGALR